MSAMTPTEAIYVVEASDYRFRWDGPQCDLTPPNERVAEALRRIDREFDSLECEALNCAAGENRNGVGWYLDDSDDNPHSGMHYTAIVDDGQAAHLICEDCHVSLLPRKAACTNCGWPHSGTPCRTVATA